MKREMKLAVVVYIWVFCLGGLARGAENPLLERTIDAIRMVESRGNANAVGDNGRAIGAYQIHRDYWIDGTQALKVKWPYSDARDEAKARQVVRAYLLRYERKGNPESWCRLHNSGPGWKKKMQATDGYWAKAKVFLQLECGKS